MATDVRRACSQERDAHQAVRDVARQLAGPGLNAVVFFASSSYDLEALAAALSAAFSCPVNGCTTAGEVCSPLGYARDSLVAVGFASPDIAMTPVLIESLTECISQGVCPGLGDAAGVSGASGASGGNRFALLLVDGLSMREEQVASAVHAQLPDVPLIGGSAGDGLHFRQTHVYHGGRFHTNAAVVLLFETSLPFETFRIQHFTPTETRLVITQADVEQRRVGEINGMPAAGEYARMVGVAESALTPGVFAAHPLMLGIGGEYFVRSIAKANEDGSLDFFCAIEEGLVLRMGQGQDLLANLRQHLDRLSRAVPNMQLVLWCDCILRRIEVEDRNALEAFQEILAPFPCSGFNTYGEQCNGIHVNQTLTGLVLGGRCE